MRQSRTDWFHAAKWGVFMHYLEHPGVSAEAWNKRIDAFDVTGLARQLEEVRAPYFVLTIGQNSGHHCSPNATYDKITGITPSKCSRRDLIADLYDVLAPRGIRLMVYLPAGAPEHEAAAVEKMQWTKGGRCAHFQRCWESVIREWSLRWGRKVHGWWFDGCYYNDDMYRHAEEPNFKSFAAAVRAGNPDSIVGWNPGVKYPPYTVDEEEDYTAGEVNELSEVDSPGRWDKQAQFHILTFLGKFWMQTPIRFTAGQAINHTLAFTNHGGVVTWDACPTKEGHIHPDAMAVLRELGPAINATRGKPDTAPPRFARPSVAIVKAPTHGDAAARQGCFRITLHNRLSEPVRGEIDLSIEPAGFADIQGPARISYDLAPAARIVTEHTFTIRPAAATDVRASIALQRLGDIRKLQYPLPSREAIIIPRLPKLPALNDLAAAMRDIPARAIVLENGQGIAYVKFAVADGHLAISSKVSDLIMNQTPLKWDGSCMEVFGVASPADRINQLFCVPAVGNLPAQVFSMLPQNNSHAYEFKTTPQAQYATWPCQDGYTSAALIPLAWWLKTPTTPETFYLEIVLTGSVDPNTYRRATMFTSVNPAGENLGYALMTPQS
ncbi:MAG: hypothetical protein IT440_07940 [Phycisphaeraceae bacterium]|nr:hypothetical protein [Phycisphaeraceae bacterium]